MKEKSLPFLVRICTRILSNYLIKHEDVHAGKGILIACDPGKKDAAVFFYVERIKRYD